MGKYTGLKGKLPPGPRSGDTTAYREKVDGYKLLIKNRDPKSLMQKYREARATKEEIEFALSDASAEARAAEELLLDAMDEMGVTQLKAEDGTLFYEEFVPSARVLDSDAAERWARERGHDFLFGLVSQRLAPFVKEMALAGETVPPCFELASYTKLKMRKGANSGSEKGEHGATEENPF